MIAWGQKASGVVIGQSKNREWVVSVGPRQIVRPENGTVARVYREGRYLMKEIECASIDDGQRKARQYLAGRSEKR